MSEATKDIKHADGEGWGVWEMECPNCGHEWVLVAPIPTIRFECHICNHKWRAGDE